MIQIKGLKKRYQSGTTVVQALRGVDLEIHNGEFLSIAGPSGSGKTTLLNLIGCLDTADEGTITIDSVNVAEKSRKELALLRRERIGFVFQSFNLIPVLTAYENASFPLSLLGVSEKEVHDRTIKILEEVGLEDMMYRRPAELSGGQQQRVAIARALIKSPDLVLADEPTANLDSETGQDILDLMEVLNEKHNTTFIFSTHDKMVMDFAHRLIRLHDGKISSDELTPRAAPGNTAAGTNSVGTSNAEAAAPAAGRSSENHAADRSAVDRRG